MPLSAAFGFCSHAAVRGIPSFPVARQLVVSKASSPAFRLQLSVLELPKALISYWMYIQKRQVRIAVVLDAQKAQTKLSNDVEVRESLLCPRRQLRL
eukprot:6200135-Amphidinium_carterae.1